MRIGKIVEAKYVSGSRNLIKMIVDFGNEKRQAVAGLLQWYKPEALVGKKYAFLLNLKRRKFMGIESPKKYRKKPVVVEALQWTGDNLDDVKEFLTSDGLYDSEYLDYVGDSLGINTLEGTMFAKVGDYIIKGVKGEFYPCKPDIFNETYELFFH